MRKVDIRGKSSLELLQPRYQRGTIKVYRGNIGHLGGRVMSSASSGRGLIMLETGAFD